MTYRVRHWSGLAKIFPSHGENRGSIPLGSANEIKYLDSKSFPKTSISEIYPKYTPANNCGWLRTSRP